MKKLILILSIVTPGLAFAQLTDSSKRLVHMQGALNFRDIGGYKTVDGKSVKWGKIFRSASINKLTDSDIKLMEQRAISTVIDFRGQSESAAAPDRLPEGADYTLSPAGSDSLPDMSKMMTLIKEGGFLEKMYGAEGLPYFGDRYRPLFIKLLSLDNNDALMYHCTGGRDRTGMATALLLYILGVPQEIIDADFTASNVYLRPMMGQMSAMLAKAGSDLTEADISKQMELRPELIHIFFAAIKDKYGSIENFLQQEIGIGKKEIAILKEKYTI